jgi:hypothetical protein
MMLFDISSSGMWVAVSQVALALYVTRTINTTARLHMVTARHHSVSTWIGTGILKGSASGEQANLAYGHDQETARKVGEI